MLQQRNKKMKFIKKAKEAIYSACLYFTAAEFLILSVASVLGMTAPEKGAAAGMFINLGSTALVFAACLVLALLNNVWKLDYSLTVRFVLHFIGALAAWAVIFIIIPGVYGDVAQIIVRSAIFAVLYLIAAVIALLIRSIIRNKRTEDLEYESKFGDFSGR